MEATTTTTNKITPQNKNTRKEMKNLIDKILISIHNFIYKPKRFMCYEIWRPNIPADGCKEQCEECKQKENQQPIKNN